MATRIVRLRAGCALFACGLALFCTESRADGVLPWGEVVKDEREAQPLVSGIDEAELLRMDLCRQNPGATDTVRAVAGLVTWVVERHAS